MLRCSQIKAPLPTWAGTNSRCASSSTRWQTRQGRDKLVTRAKVEGLKSRAAYKLLEINEKHKIFRPGQTVVDLGFAPGSWSQVAVDRTRPNGLVLGIDVIPAQPPQGVSTIQGNFLSPAVQDEVKKFLRAGRNGKQQRHLRPSTEEDDASCIVGGFGSAPRSYLEQQKQSEILAPELIETGTPAGQDRQDLCGGRMVDVVLSDMMMNTSGINFRDHAGSMDLCEAALRFASDTLRAGGHFICKFYQGAEDKALEARLKTLFSKVYRDKPASSRSESKEAFFVALSRKNDISSTEMFD
ncbi:2' O-ribose methyltransferase [Xanthoria calcicola]